ncbi:hypothetical protein ACRAWF_21055 [Streptomyces sp. L7]
MTSALVVAYLGGGDVYSPPRRPIEERHGSPRPSSTSEGVWGSALGAAQGPPS